MTLFSKALALLCSSHLSRKRQLWKVSLQTLSNNNKEKVFEVNWTFLLSHFKLLSSSSARGKSSKNNSGINWRTRSFATHHQLHFTLSYSLGTTIKTKQQASQSSQYFSFQCLILINWITLCICCVCNTLV